MNSFVDSDSSSELKRGSFLGQEDEMPFTKLSGVRIWNGIKTIANASLFTSLSLLSIFCVNLISLGYISTLKDAAMIGGIGLGFTCSNFCVYVLLSSVGQGVNVSAGQAFGAQKHEYVSLNYHRGLFIMLIILIPTLILLAFTKPLLVIFGVSLEISEYTWTYVAYSYPSYFFYGIFDCTKSYLYAQKIFKPVLYAQIMTTALHFLWGWFFIVKLNMGCAGAGIAKSIYELSNVVIILAYIYLSNCSDESWIPLSEIRWRNEVLRWDGMKIFLELIIPIAFLLLIDITCYQMFTLIAGKFGENQLAVHVAIANTVTVYYNISFGMSIAVMTYVANSVGEEMYNHAKNYTFFGIILNVFVTFIFITVLWIFKSEWINLLSPNQAVKDSLSGLIKLSFMLIIFDGIQVIISGTMKGINKQISATTCLIISYGFISFPLIYLFAFRLEWKVAGIWSGFLIGTICLLLLYLLVLNFTNFKAQIRKIRKGFLN